MAILVVQGYCTYFISVLCMLIHVLLNLIIHVTRYSFSFRYYTTHGEQKEFGISDVWRGCGQFSNISKEMTPENRKDLLVDALVHYGQRTVRKLGIPS